MPQNSHPMSLFRSCCCQSPRSFCNNSPPSYPHSFLTQIFLAQKSGHRCLTYSLCQGDLHASRTLQKADRTWVSDNEIFDTTMGGGVSLSGRPVRLGDLRPAPPRGPEPLPPTPSLTPELRAEHLRADASASVHLALWRPPPVGAVVPFIVPGRQHGPAPALTRVSKPTAELGPFSQTWWEAGGPPSAFLGPVPKSRTSKAPHCNPGA